MTTLLCPETHLSLEPSGDALVTPNGGRSYPILDGIPSLVFPKQLAEDDARSSTLYGWLAPFYRVAEIISMKAVLGVDMRKAWRDVGDCIPARPSEKVLEVSPGPGIYQPFIAEKIGRHGELTALDLSRQMLAQCQKTTRKQSPKPRLIHGNAAYLPFPDHHFDGVFHFGGLDLFSEPEKALGEFARVVKPGGWVVYGDERFSTPWQARQDWRVKWVRKANPGFNRMPPPNPESLLLHEEKEVMEGLAYLRLCTKQHHCPPPPAPGQSHLIFIPHKQL